MEDSTINLLNTTILFPAYAKLLLLSAGLGMFIGFERELHQKPASVRTFALICAGSCLFALLSLEAAAGHSGSPYDVTRVAAGIVTGIGFMGGGVIFKTADRVEGITTGAMIWLAAGIGMACGFNYVAVAVWGTLTFAGIIIFGHAVHGLARAFQFEEEEFAEKKPKKREKKSSG